VYPLLEDVLPWLLGLYLLDSIAWSVREETLFARPFRSFFTARGPLLAGLSPWSEVVSAVSWPVRLSPASVFWPDRDGRLTEVPWTALGTVERTDRSLQAAGRSFRAPSPDDARRIARALVRLRDAPPGARAAELNALVRERGDVGAARRLRQGTERHAQALSALGAAFLFALFVLLPLGLGPWAAFVPPPTHTLAGLALLYLAIVVLGWRTLRGCGLSKGQAFGALSNLFYLPATAGHARSFLSRRLFADYDTLTVAAVLLPAPAFRRLARETFHRIRREGADGLADPARLAEEAWRRVVAESGQDAAAVLSAPSPADPSAANYCPLCSTEYRALFQERSDCRIGLLPLAAG